MHALRPPASKVSPRRATTVAFVLAMALLCAQWVGMLHRIDHASGQGDPQLHAQTEGGLSGKSSSSISHSCVVFDGAYLADLLPTALVAIASARTAQGLPPGADFASWQGLFFSHFLSRAPPAA